MGYGPRERRSASARRLYFIKPKTERQVVVISLKKVAVLVEVVLGHDSLDFGPVARLIVAEVATEAEAMDDGVKPGRVLQGDAIALDRLATGGFNWSGERPETGTEYPSRSSSQPAVDETPLLIVLSK